MKELALTHGGMGVATLCRLLGLSESSFYYAETGYTDSDDDLDVLAVLVKQAGKRPTDGYRRLTKALRKKKRFKTLNTKRVQTVDETGWNPAETPQEDDLHDRLQSCVQTLSKSRA